MATVMVRAQAQPKVSVASTRRGVRDTVAQPDSALSSSRFSRLYAARCSGRGGALVNNLAFDEFQSPLRGEVFGTFFFNNGYINFGCGFQSPLRGEVFGTRII